MSINPRTIGKIFEIVRLMIMIGVGTSISW